MARSLRIKYPGAFYHVIQRGIERKNILISDSDKEKFLFYLDSVHTRYGAIIHSYVLMGNHYHIILETPRSNLSKIMHCLDTSYATYFNTKRKRIGPLYQGRFKAILVQQDEYLHYLSRYIHLNPVRTNIIEDPIEYHWSSYKYFISKDKPPKWLNTNFVLSMFGNNVIKAKDLYKQFVLDGIGQEKDIIKENTKKGFILGSEDFLESVKERFIDNVRENPEIPILKELKHKKEPTMEHLKHIVEEKISNNKRLQRKLSIYLSRKYTQKKLNEIAAFYGKIKDTGVSQVFIRTEKERKENKNLDKLLQTIEKMVNVQCGDLTPL